MIPQTIRIAIAQVNPTVGDLEQNFQKIVTNIDLARQNGAQIVVFPEMVLTGYPPEDLLLKPDFVEAVEAYTTKLANASDGIVAIVGTVHKQEQLYNAGLVLQNGSVKAYYHKERLPNYSVFDESRYFHTGHQQLVFGTDPLIFGVSICEDIWVPKGPPDYQAREGGANLLINISASPYYQQKGAVREQLLSQRARDNRAYVVYCNMVGGQDELVFDGQSLVFSPDGNLLMRGKLFEEQLIVVELDYSHCLADNSPTTVKQPRSDQSTIQLVELEPLNQGLYSTAPTLITATTDPVVEIYKALVLGVGDYIRKCSFKTCALGLSGGVDSSLVATIAADAIGAENVTGIGMPSRFSSSHSLEDAELLARNLNIPFKIIPIEPMFQAFLATLAPLFGDLPTDITEENIQSRIRGVLLMAFSNKFGALILTTGNKSEVGVGYSTLYGDSAGGFAAIKDVPKTVVYELCRYRNKIAGYDVIPERVLTKPPSAELRENQKDSDSLPDYGILDPIIELYVEKSCAPAEIINQGFSADTVKRVIRLIDSSEYKRRQSPPGIKITERAFGKDWRVPITNKYH